MPVTRVGDIASESARRWPGARRQARQRGTAARISASRAFFDHETNSQPASPPTPRGHEGIRESAEYTRVVLVVSVSARNIWTGRHMT
jgi:hypothetical protein